MFEDVNTSPSLEGDMSIPGKRSTTTTAQNGVPEYNTLDEPIRETVLRDIRAVGIKFYHVLYPKEKSSLLRDCTSSFVVMRFVCVSNFIMCYLYLYCLLQGISGVPWCCAPLWPPSCKAPPRPTACLTMVQSSLRSLLLSGLALPL